MTDAVLDEVKTWQSRPLDALYPIVYMDCIHVKVRDSGAVRVKAPYLAIGVNLERAKFAIRVVTELKNRGGRYLDCLCGWIEGLPGRD